MKAVNINIDTNTVEVIMAVAVPAFIILLSWVAKLIAAFIEIKVTEIKERTKNEKIKACIDIVADDAINIVYMLNQTVVEGLKEGSLDGRLTAADAANIKSMAFNMLLNTLSQDVKDTINSVYGDLDTYLNNVIEKTVVKAKNESAAKIAANKAAEAAKVTETVLTEEVNEDVEVAVNE